MGFYIQDDYWAAASSMRPPDRKTFLDAICSYYFTEEEPKNLKGQPRLAFLMAKKRIDLSRQSTERKRKERDKKRDSHADSRVTTLNREGEGEGECEYLDSDESKYAALPFLKALNDVLGSSYAYMPPECEGRLIASGFTVDQVSGMIAEKAVEWDNAEMRRHLTPSTLFGKNFPKYMDEHLNSERRAASYERFKPKGDRGAARDVPE